MKRLFLSFFLTAFAYAQQCPQGYTLTGSVCVQNGGTSGGLTQISVGSIASVPSCTSTFLYLPTDSFYDQVACDSSSVLHYLRGGSERWPTTLKTWAWSNQNSNTETTATGTSSLTIFDTALTVQWSGKVTALPHGAPYTYTVFMKNQANGASGQSSTAGGAWITDGTKQIHVEVLCQTAPNASLTETNSFMRVEHIATSTDGGTSYFVSGIVPQSVCTGATEVGLRIADSGSALSYSYSLDGGASWTGLGGAESNTAYLTATFIGFGGTSVTNSAFPFEVLTITSARFQ